MENLHEDPNWISRRRAIELENRERIRYFDMYVDTLPLDIAIQTYKETLEHQGIPLSPARIALEQTVKM